MDGPSEPRSRCATVVHFALPRFGLLRSQFTIYWIFGGLGDLERFRGRPGPETGQKHRKGGSPVLGLTKLDRMLNADPVNPVWGPMRPWGPRYGRFGGGWEPFRRLGTGFPEFPFPDLRISQFPDFWISHFQISGFPDFRIFGLSISGFPIFGFREFPSSGGLILAD